MAHSSKFLLKYGNSDTQQSEFSIAQLRGFIKRNKALSAFIGIEVGLLFMAFMLFTFAPVPETTGLRRGTASHYVWGTVFLSWAVLLGGSAGILAIMDNLPKARRRLRG